ALLEQHPIVRHKHRSAQNSTIFKVCEISIELSRVGKGSCGCGGRSGSNNRRLADCSNCSRCSGCSNCTDARCTTPYQGEGEYRHAKAKPPVTASPDTVYAHLLHHTPLHEASWSSCAP